MMDYVEEKAEDAINPPSKVRTSVARYEIMVSGIKPDPAPAPPQMEKPFELKPAIRKISFFDEHHPVISPADDKSGTNEPNNNSTNITYEIMASGIDSNAGQPQAEKSADKKPAIRKISFYDERHPEIHPEVQESSTDEPNTNYAYELIASGLNAVPQQAGKIVDKKPAIRKISFYDERHPEINRPEVPESSADEPITNGTINFEASEDSLSIKSLGDVKPAAPKSRLRKISADAILLSRVRDIPALQKRLVDNVVNGLRSLSDVNSPPSPKLTRWTSNLEMDTTNGISPAPLYSSEVHQEPDVEREAIRSIVNRLEKMEWTIDPPFKPEEPRGPYPEYSEIAAEYIKKKMELESKESEKKIKNGIAPAPLINPDVPQEQKLERVIKDVNKLDKIEMTIDPLLKPEVPQVPNPEYPEIAAESMEREIKMESKEFEKNIKEHNLQTPNLEMNEFRPDRNEIAPVVSINPKVPPGPDVEREVMECIANGLEATIDSSFKPEIHHVPYLENPEIAAKSANKELKMIPKERKKKMKGIMKELKTDTQPAVDDNFTYIPKLELLAPNFDKDKYNTTSHMVGSPAIRLDDYNTVLESPFHDFDRVKGSNGLPLPDGLHLTELAAGSGGGHGGEGGGKESRRGALLAAFVACLDSAALGTVIGYASPAIPDINRHPNPFHLNGVQQMAWVASMIALGEMVGGGLCGPVLDKYGRKLVIIANTVPFILGWLIIAAAPNVEWLFVGRFLTGFCAGVVDVAVPVYLAEVSPADIRGFVGSCYELFVNLGIFFVFGFGCLIPYNWLAIACAFVPTVMMILMCFMPETPRFLMSKGNQVGAQQALTILRGPKADTSKELNEIIDNIQQSTGDVTWRDFIQPTLYKPLYIVLGLMLIQQFSGYGVVYEYTVIIFSSAGIKMSPNLQTAIVGLSGVLSNLVSAFLVDRTGRKAMLLVSASIMAVSMAAMGAFFITKEYNADFALAYISWLPILSLVSYNAGLNVGFGPIPFYMAGELFPLKTRGITCGICIAIWSLFFFLVSRYFMEVTILVHDYGAYWILSGVSVMAIFFVILVVPETKGKTLEEIEESFRSR